MFLEIPHLDKLFKRLKTGRLDDFADRCNYYYTVLLLLFFAILIGSKQHFGEPIRCFVDQQYARLRGEELPLGESPSLRPVRVDEEHNRGVPKAPEFGNSPSDPSLFLASWIAYVHDFCFISERYSFTPPDYEEHDGLSRFDHTASKKFENYYQWVPFVLAAQAFIFVLPRLFFDGLQAFSGMDLESVVGESVRVRTMLGEQRANAVRDLVKYVEQYMRLGSSLNDVAEGSGGRFGVYSSAVYVLSKLLSVGNIIAQLYITSFFVGDGSCFFGVELAQHLLAGRDWTVTGNFPRVVFCDYDRVELGNLQSKTVQCTLAINILNEKVYVLITFWLMGLLALTLANALYCAAILFIPSLRRREAFFFLAPMLGAVKGRKPLELDANGEHIVAEQDRFGENFSYGENTVQKVYDSNTRRRMCAKRNVDDVRSMMSMLMKSHTDACVACDGDTVLKAFIKWGLCVDGVLLLRFVSEHAGSLLASDIACALFAHFRSSYAVQCRLHRRFQAPPNPPPMMSVSNIEASRNGRFLFEGANALFRDDASAVTEIDAFIRNRFGSCSCSTVLPVGRTEWMSSSLDEGMGTGTAAEGAESACCETQGTQEGDGEMSSLLDTRNLSGPGGHISRR